MLRIISAVLLLLILCESSDACFRCRRFDNRCRYRVQKQIVIQQKQIAVPVAVPQNITNITTVYPSSNTQYTLGQAAAIYAGNPDLAMTLASRVADNSVSMMSSAINSAMQQSGEVAQVAKLQAARDHLMAAMSTNTQPSSVTLKITQGAGGIDIQQVDDASLGAQDMPPQSILGTKCAKCHGTGQAAPKGDLFLDTGHELTGDAVARALNMVRLDKMPPENPLQPAEKAAVMEELLNLFKKE